jgi:hypothetical protein
MTVNQPGLSDFSSKREAMEGVSLIIGRAPIRKADLVARFLSH